MDYEYINLVLQVINNVVYTYKGRYLNDIEEQVLSGSLEGKKYREIAEEHQYCTEYLSQDIGFKLWRMLTEVLGESVNKKNIKGVCRRALENSSFDCIPER